VRYPYSEKTGDNPVAIKVTTVIGAGFIGSEELLEHVLKSSLFVGIGTVLSG